MLLVLFEDGNDGFKFHPTLDRAKMLDEHHPTWVAKRSNNVRSSKVGALNITSFDSLTRALDSLVFSDKDDKP